VINLAEHAKMQCLSLRQEVGFRAGRDVCLVGHAMKQLGDAHFWVSEGEPSATPDPAPGFWDWDITFEKCFIVSLKRNRALLLA